MALDIIILAAIAGFLIYRLYLVLGERNDADQSKDMPGQPDPFIRTPDSVQRGNGQRGTAAAADAAKPVEAVIVDHDPNLPVSLEAGLKQIAALDPQFDEKGFVKGARAAFEMIIKAYAAGDLGALKPLLSDDLYHSFADDIRARNARGEKLETTIHAVKDADMSEARLDRTTALIGVRFISTQSSVTRDANSQILYGDQAAQHSVNDHWVFARNLRSEDPNWQLVETLDS